MNQKDIFNSLETLPFYSHLSEEEIETLKTGVQSRVFPANALIHSGCDDCLGMIRVLKGGIRTALLSEEGREITLFRLAPGDICVLSASCVIHQITFDTEMTAIGETALMIISPAIFRRLVEGNIYVRCFTYEMMTKRFSDVMWTMQQILFMGYDKRLAIYLHTETENTGNSELHMTHEEIARDTGTAREVVSRMLKRFADEGIVSINRGQIRITDQGRVKKLANLKMSD